MISAARSRASFVCVALIVLGAAPLYYQAYQFQKDRRFEIGSMDRDFLAEPTQFSSPLAMSGPIRYEDGSVAVIDFYGRLTARCVELELPYHALRSPLRLFLRAHRFGLQGRVLLEVNGELLGEFVFAKSSYPWGGLRAIVPQSVAEGGPLHIELVTEGGDPPPSHMSEETGVGLDWIDVSPMSQGAVLRPSPAAYGALYAFVLSGFAFALLSRLSLSRATMVLAVLVALACASTALFPVETSVALARLWIVFPFAFAVQLAVTRVRGMERGDASFGSRLVAIAALAHSVLIFFPNHLPPDVPLHSLQVSWLSSADVSYSGLVEYSRALSRSITPEAVLMDIGREDPGSEEASRQSFGAPYPPFFYLLAYSVSRLHGDLRFVLEFLAVAMAALMLVLVFLIAKAIGAGGVTARLAAILFAMEISVWHHANRGHAPGLFGALFVLLFLWYLLCRFRGDSLRRPWGILGFALLTAAVALCYTVAFIQISMFTFFFTLLLLLTREGRRSPLVFPMLAGFALGIAAAVAVFYAPYVAAMLTPSEESGVLLPRASDYDPPATFYFLRNQLRDSVRILQNGHVVFVLLSIAGLGFLRHSQTSLYHRCWIGAGLLTYALILVLKDPAFLPRIFLHAKEDLFYAPFACLLGALPLAWLWSRPRLRSLVVAVFLGLGYLSIRDKTWNADTLHAQPIANAIESPSTRDGRAV